MVNRNSLLIYLLVLIMSGISGLKAQVTVYEGCNYTGRSLDLYPGKYDLKSLGWCWKNISAIDINGDYTVTLYNLADQKGDYINYTDNESCLPDAYNNQAASLVVGRTVYLYSDCDLEGYWKDIGMGTWTATRIEKWLGNESLMSLEVPEDMMVTYKVSGPDGTYQFGKAGDLMCLDDWLSTREKLLSVRIDYDGPLIYPDDDCEYLETFDEEGTKRGWFTGDTDDYEFSIEDGKYYCELYEDNESGWLDYTTRWPKSICAQFNNDPEGRLEFDLRFDDEDSYGFYLLFAEHKTAPSCKLGDHYKLEIIPEEDQLLTYFYDDNACSGRESVVDIVGGQVPIEGWNHVVLQKSDGGCSWTWELNGRTVLSLNWANYPLFASQIDEGSYLIDNIAYCPGSTPPLPPPIVLPPPVNPPVFHALIYSDSTEGNGRGCDRKVEIEKMDKFFSGIADALGYVYAPEIGSAEEFTAQKALADIRNLSVRDSDVVAFYYNGHGGNHNLDEWPSLSFEDMNYHSTRMLNLLENKASNAKLILFITSCCNADWVFEDYFPSDEELIRESDPEIFEANIRSLFLGNGGRNTIRMCSSRDGDLSRSTPCEYEQLPWSPAGSEFSNQFRKVFTDYCFAFQENPTWDTILQRACRPFKSWRSSVKGEFIIPISSTPYSRMYKRFGKTDTAIAYESPYKLVKIDRSDRDEKDENGRLRCSREYKVTNNNGKAIKFRSLILPGYYRNCQTNDYRTFNPAKTYSSKWHRIGPGDTKTIQLSSDFMDTQSIIKDGDEYCFRFLNSYNTKWIRE